MNIQAIYEHAVLKPIQPLNLKNKLVTIYVPDEEVSGEEIKDQMHDLAVKYNLPPEVEAMAKDLLARLAAVTEEVMKISEEDLPVVTKKQLERMEAFEMREDRRSRCHLRTEWIQCSGEL
jgi:predicted DNA-binding antitoxin AbrB/MazE fold protein